MKPAKFLLMDKEFPAHRNEVAIADKLEPNRARLRGPPS
jgi:hypothetical protein